MGASRKVYGSLHNSPSTLKVIACLFEHDLDFEFVPIDVDAGENKMRPFLSISPFGQLPAYEEDGITQFEQRAIMRSLAHHHSREKQSLIYWETRNQAIVSIWIDVEDHKFEPPALRLTNELLIKPKAGLLPDQKVVSDAEAALTKVFDVYEARLTKFKYLASDNYTIVDVLHLPNLQSLMDTTAGKKVIDSRPHVSAWCSEILARPAWTKVLRLQQHEAF